MKPKIVVIDNYDSFVYNLVQYVGELGAEVVIFRNDAVSVAEIEALDPDGVLISPGPGYPCDAGISMDVIAKLRGGVPIFGVCLGHQAIGEVFGATVVRATELMHGKTSPVTHDGQGLFCDIESPMVATRYHSLVIDPTTLPDELECVASTSDGVIMAVKHTDLPIYGVQFHPESVLTLEGKTLVANFVGIATSFQQTKVLSKG